MSADPAALGDADFAYLRALVHAETGIHLSEGKRAFLAGRLSRRLRAIGITTYADYCRHLRAGDEDERTALFDAVCTHETRFFREPAHFDLIARVWIPAWLADVAAGRRPPRVRLWSAGCSTGEEAYSLAMTLHEGLAEGEIAFEVLATDLSTGALETARAGLYPLARADEIPPARLQAFMLRGRGRWEGKMRAGPEIRRVIRFEQLNLQRLPYDVGAPFDVIFCRNVLIYFDAATRVRVVNGLLARLSPGGALFVGHAEGLHTAGMMGDPAPTPRARSIFPSVYVPLGARRDEA